MNGPTAPGGNQRGGRPRPPRHRPDGSRGGGQAPQSKQRQLDPLPGAATFVSLSWELRTDPPEVRIDETEAILTRSAGGPEAVIEIGQVRGPASGLTEEDEQTLQRLLAHAQERVAVVLYLDLGSENSPWPRLDLNVYTYDVGPSGSSLAIGVADVELASVRRAAGDRYGRRSPEWALNWLTERLVLPSLPGSPPGSPNRLVISAGPRTSSEEPVAFRVHGRGVAADVSTATGRTMLSRVVLRAHDAAQGPLKLIHRTVTFTDETQAISPMRRKRSRPRHRAADQPTPVRCPAPGSTSASEFPGIDPHLRYGSGEARRRGGRCEGISHQGAGEPAGR